MPPVTTYTGLILWNCQFVQAAVGDFDLDDLDVCRSFTGTRDERWFHMICAAIEARAGSAIARLTSTTKSVNNGDIESVIAAVNFTAETIQQLTRLSQEIHTRVDPAVWFHKLRPFLAGSIDERLPSGVSFDGGRSYVRLAGANAGQSSVFQFFDAVLGIEHRSDFAARMRAYMPGPHARLLCKLESIPSIGAHVKDHTTNERLTAAYKVCLKELRIFRDKHIRIVGRYIVIPAREASSGHDRNETKKELKGVGGAALMPFLRGMRDETRVDVLRTREQLIKPLSTQEGHSKTWTNWAQRKILAWLPQWASVVLEPAKKDNFCTTT